jgi:hypothetical protein
VTGARDVTVQVAAIGVRDALAPLGERDRAMVLAQALADEALLCERPALFLALVLEIARVRAGASNGVAG